MMVSSYVIQLDTETDRDVKRERGFDASHASGIKQGDK